MTTHPPFRKIFNGVAKRDDVLRLRARHDCGPFKARPDGPRSPPAHSLYSAELGAHDPERYRMMPPYAPDVLALVQPGTAVRTSYGTGGIVIAIEGPTIHVASDGREYPHFTIVYVPNDRLGRYSKLDRNWINECVAVDGRILKLLEANADEVFVEAVDAGPP